jgi:hypothetical protein
MIITEDTMRAALFKPDQVRPIDRVIDYFGDGRTRLGFQWPAGLGDGRDETEIRPAGDRPGPADHRSAGS